MPFLRYAILALLILSLPSYGYAAETKSYINITAENPLKIGVPANPFSNKFVNVNRAKNNVTGFCISVFKEAINELEHEIYYDFVVFDGTYDELVSRVADKTFDAAVGDITIMADRWTLVEFSEPFSESGLAMVVPVKPAEGWIFLKPFTTSLWLATGGILVYTMFVVWFIEHRSNPEFSGTWKDQLENALFFAFSSLFFAHRERINRTYTRVVVIVWLFVVLILTQSYTASLTSMLTVKRLNPNIESFNTEITKVGCDDNTFMQNYVEHELGYKKENIKPIVNENDYFEAFKDGSISAAFLEIPYAKLFVNTHCKEFTVTGSSYRFGGLSFAFQKGSGMAYNVSEAILKISENGKLKYLEELWLTSSSECTEPNTADPDSLSFQSFWGLYLFSAIVSTLCFLLFVVQLLNKYRHYGQTQGNNDNDANIWKNFIGVVKYLKNTEPGDRRLASSSSKVMPEIEMLEDPDCKA